MTIISVFAAIVGSFVLSATVIGERPLGVTKQEVSEDESVPEGEFEDESIPEVEAPAPWPLDEDPDPPEPEDVGSWDMDEDPDPPMPPEPPQTS